jgi:inner membrane protein
MPTIFSHALLPLAAGAAAGRVRVPARLAVIGALLAILPDTDVIGRSFGLTYADDWGHRGATHSFAFAILVVGMIALLWKPARNPCAFGFLLASIVSHTLFDMLTDGGQGVILYWPLDSTRYFLPWQPIRVAPIGLRFFTERGWETVWSELLLVWLPSFLIVGLVVALRRRRAR